MSQPQPTKIGLPKPVETLPPPADRIFASFLGLAICDALGAPVEFKLRDTFPPVTTYQPCHHFKLPPGTPTDDTSMALGLGCSLLSLPGGVFDHQNQALQYLNWYTTGLYSATNHCFDIGATTLRALDLWRTHRQSTITASSPSWSNAKGNGSLMRVLPIALATYRNPEIADKWARKQSTVTHPAEMCQIACALYVHLVGGILRGEFEGGKGELVKAMEGWGGYGDGEEGGKVKEAMTGVASLSRSEIRSTGYVLDTLQAAVWGFLNTEGFVEGARLVVNLGDDADTVGAVYGGLAGAWYGQNGEGGFWEDETVGEWRRGLGMRGAIEVCAEGLAILEGRAEREK